MNCPYCDGSKVHKNGHKYNKQRYLCRECGKSFCEKDDRIKRDVRERQVCLILYSHNMSLRSIQSSIEKLFNTKIAIRTIEKWVKSFVKTLKIDLDKEKKKEKSKTIEVLEMDELYSKYYDLKKNEWNTLKYGLLLIGEEIKLLHLK